MTDTAHRAWVSEALLRVPGSGIVYVLTVAVSVSAGVINATLAV